MSKRVKYGILLIVVTQLLIVIGLLTIPRVVQALPGEYRVRLARLPLMEPLLEFGTTPLPTALPAPAAVAAQLRITIPSIQPTATVTPEPTATAAPTKAITNETTAVLPTATPIPTATATPTQTPTPLPLPPQARIEGLKIMPQGFNNCGPANLTINLNFYGDGTWN
jgi:hypothetical protein